VNRREAKKVAHAIASNLILHWRMGDSPKTFDGVSVKDAERIDRALHDLEEQHRRLGYPNVMDGESEAC